MAVLEHQNKISGGAFGPTHWSVIFAAGGLDSPQTRHALETLCRAYWPPLYAYVRRCGHNPHDAQDLTQEFFARLLARSFLHGVSPSKGKFRSFLLAALNHFMVNDRERSQAAKRGGGGVIFSLDAEGAESSFRLEPVSHLSPDKLYDRRWAECLLARALAALQSEFESDGKGSLFETLKPFLEDGTGRREYEVVAGELGMTPNAVAVAVHRLRQRYRELVRYEVSQTVATPGEIEGELRCLAEAISASS